MEIQPTYPVCQHCKVPGKVYANETRRGQERNDDLFPLACAECTKKITGKDPTHELAWPQRPVQ